MFVLLADGDIRAPVFRVGYFLWFVEERDIGQGERDGTALRFFRFSITAKQSAGMDGGLTLW